MDIVRAIKFPFEDDEWPLKIIVGSLLSLIPFIGFGYQIAVARNVINDKHKPLPGTDDLGQVLTDTIMGTIAWVVYFLPIILISCVLIFPAMAAGDSDLGSLLVCISSSCIFVLALLYAIPALLLYWMGIIRYCETGNFAEFVKLGSLWRDIRINFSPLLILLLYVVALSIIGSVVSGVIWITCIGIPLVSFLGYTATGHLIGQTAQIIYQSE
ncbi:MAG: DUF4013 domain-containing protein [Anaerolineae bacterium]|nr:DUF4013 domain-containing protein [Anaerolineae bacterium]